MDDKTLGILYALKRAEDPYAGVNKFMKQYSGSEVDYTKSEINKLVEQAFCECLNDAQGPSEIVKDYFRHRQDPYFFSPMASMACAIQNIQVRQWDKDTNLFQYINGFRPMKEFNDD